MPMAPRLEEPYSFVPVFTWRARSFWERLASEDLECHGSTFKKPGKATLDANSSEIRGKVVGVRIQAD
jgi:hypothetical protein